MPSYRAQVVHNEDTCGFLGTETPKYVDWEITTLFYAALHSINRCFELQGVEIPRLHRERREAIEDKLPNIAKSYRALKVLSEQSRYDGRGEVDSNSMEEARKLYSEIMVEIQKYA